MRYRRAAITPLRDHHEGANGSRRHAGAIPTPHLFPMRALLGLVISVSLLLPPQGAAESGKLILVLGDDAYIPAKAVRASTGAVVKTVLGRRDLAEFAVLVLSNVPYDTLPQAVRERLPEFLRQGGSLLITGGPNAYGSGGYRAIDSFIPFEIRTDTDWTAAPFKAVVPVQPNHPILSGVTFRTIGTFNDLNPKRVGTAEIAHYAGGATFDASGKIIGSRFPSPLIAEQRIAQGTVVGIAFDLGREIRSGWSDGTRFLLNALAYLAERSPLRPRSATDLIQMFLRWEAMCDRELRRSKTGGAHWKATAADCRRQLVHSGYPHGDLIDQWLVERLGIAEEAEAGRLSPEESERRMKTLRSRIQREIAEREQSTE